MNDDYQPISAYRSRAAAWALSSGAKDWESMTDDELVAHLESVGMIGGSTLRSRSASSATNACCRPSPRH